MKKKNSVSIWAFRTSWKAYIGSIFIALFVGPLASALSGGGGSNIIWTFCWAFLTIKAWNLCKWKALIPYPLMVCVGLVAVTILNRFNVPFWPYIITLGAINIGGLVVFERKLNSTSAYDRTVNRNDHLETSAEIQREVLCDSSSCSKCGSDSPAGSKFCPRCGTALVNFESSEKQATQTSGRRGEPSRLPTAEVTKLKSHFPVEPPPLPVSPQAPPPLPKVSNISPSLPNQGKALKPQSSNCATQNNSSIDVDNSRVWIVTRPTGLEIVVNRQEVQGKTPIKVTLSKGNCRIDFFKDQEYLHTIVVDFTNQKELSYDLTKYCIDQGLIVKSKWFCLKCLKRFESEKKFCTICHTDEFVVDG